MESNWFLLNEGPSRLLRFSRKLKQETLIKVNKSICINKSEYECWMSCDPRLDEAIKLNLHLNNEVSQSIVPKHKLASLACLFTEGEDSPLGVIDSGNKTSCLVASGNNEQLGKFEKNVNQALQIIKSSSGALSELVNELILEIVPLTSRNSKIRLRENGSGLSTQYYRGCIFLSLPYSEEILLEELAINIAHELGHQALMVYQHADNIIHGPLEQPVYSAIRKCFRPAIMSYHALVALAFMYEFLISALFKNVQNNKLINYDYLLTRYYQTKADFIAAIYSFEKIELTELGKQGLGEFRCLLAKGRDLEVYV